MKCGTKPVCLRVCTFKIISGNVHENPLVGLELNHHEAFGSHPELPMQGVCTALRKKTSIFCIKDFFTQQVLKQSWLRLSSKGWILHKLWSLRVQQAWWYMFKAKSPGFDQAWSCFAHLVAFFPEGMIWPQFRLQRKGQGVPGVQDTGGQLCCTALNWLYPDSLPWFTFLCAWIALGGL